MTQATTGNKVHFSASREQLKKPHRYVLIESTLHHHCLFIADVFTYLVLAVQLNLDFFQGAVISGQLHRVLKEHETEGRAAVLSATSIIYGVTLSPS